MKPKYVGVETFGIDDVESNQFSANEEDGATYSRLKKELQEHGLLDLPVVLRSPDGKKVRILSGHHRWRGWKEIGNKKIDAIVVEGKLTKEEEFNLVNNMNAIRGDTTLSRVKRIVRQFNLDVTKLDVFKMPVNAMMPKGGTALLNEDLERKARLRDMAAKLSGELAEIIVDGRNEDLIAFAVEGKLVCIVHSQQSPQVIRKNASVFKGILEKAVAEYLENTTE